MAVHDASLPPIEAARPLRDERAAFSVFFGPGSSEQLAAHVEGLHPRSVLIVHGTTGAALAERLYHSLGAERVTSFSGIAEHVPADRAEQAVASARTAGADTVVAIGGGSAIGFAKIIARETGAQIVAVPTTYSGSEMTPVWAITAGDRKSTGRDPAVLPRLVVYDPLLTLSLPVHASAASGMNAMAHAVDALYVTDVNPVVTHMSVQALTQLNVALPAIVARPDDLPARTQALHGAHLAGMVLGSAGTALHHRMCHVLGGRFRLPHAETHAVLLPHSVAFNEHAAAAANARIAAAVHGSSAATAIWDLERTLNLPASLADLGLRADGVDAAAAEITATPVANPAAVTQAGVAHLLENALYGRTPGT